MHPIIKYILSCLALLPLYNAFDLRPSNNYLPSINGRLLTIADFYNKQQPNFVYLDGSDISVYNIHADKLFELKNIQFDVANVQARDFAGEGYPQLLITSTAVDGLHTLLYATRDGEMTLLNFKTEAVPLVFNSPKIDGASLFSLAISQEQVVSLLLRMDLSVLFSQSLFTILKANLYLLLFKLL